MWSSQLWKNQQKDREVVWFTDMFYNKLSKVFFDKSPLTSWIFVEASGTAGSEVMVPVGWYRPILNTPLRSLSLFSFSFSRAFRSFQRSSCFSLSSTAFAVEEQAWEAWHKSARARAVHFFKLWIHTFSRFFIVFRLLLYGWHIGHCNRGIQGGHFQLWEFIQLPPGVHSTFSILLLGMRPSPRHFYPKHRHTGVPLSQVSKSWLHNQVSGFFKKGNIMFWKVLQIACNGYYRH